MEKDYNETYYAHIVKKFKLVYIKCQEGTLMPKKAYHH